MEAILIAVVIALLIRTYLFEPVIVHGSSMEGTLSTGERLIIYKLGYRFDRPQRGDIIVLKHGEIVGYGSSALNKLPLIGSLIPLRNEIDYIKRVIALPGEEIDIKYGKVYINGKELDESYSKGITYEKSMKLPLTVPKGSVFVLGDNRENSRDSRETNVGFIEFDKVKGKAVLRIWPIKRMGMIEY